MTHLGSVVEEWDDENYRELFEPPYRVIYRVEGADAVVLYVVSAGSRAGRSPPV